MKNTTLRHLHNRTFHWYSYLCTIIRMVFSQHKQSFSQPSALGGGAASIIHHTTTNWEMDGRAKCHQLWCIIKTDHGGRGGGASENHKYYLSFSNIKISVSLFIKCTRTCWVDDWPSSYISSSSFRGYFI